MRENQQNTIAIIKQIKGIRVRGGDTRRERKIVGVTRRDRKIEKDTRRERKIEEEAGRERKREVESADANKQADNPFYPRHRACLPEQSLKAYNLAVKLYGKHF